MAPKSLAKDSLPAFACRQSHASHHTTPANSDRSLVGSGLLFICIAVFCCFPSFVFSLRVRLLLCKGAWYRVFRTVTMRARYMRYIPTASIRFRVQGRSPLVLVFSFTFFLLFKLFAQGLSLHIPWSTCTSTKGGQLAITYFVRHDISTNPKCTLLLSVFIWAHTEHFSGEYDHKGAGV